MSKNFAGKTIDPELLNRLDLVSTHVYPLAGGNGRRINNQVDLRLSKLQNSTGDTITYYEHFATVRDTKTNIFYIAFRETPDALLARSQDLEKFPEWLMKTREKMAECQIYLYKVYRHPKQAPTLNSHEDWLTPIDVPSVFDTIVYFLGKHNVISQEQARSY